MLEEINNVGQKAEKVKRILDGWSPELEPPQEELDVMGNPTNNDS